MLILDDPYISNFLVKTIVNNKLPVLKNEYAKKIPEITPYLLDDETFLSAIKSSEVPRIYSTTENSIGWIAKNMSYGLLPEQIDLFKDKAKFRELIKNLYPDFFFKKVSLAELEKLDANGLNFPLIVKPSTGFFSMGVYKLDSSEQWEATIQGIKREIEEVKNLYPIEVLDTNSFIIEEYIDGDEYAFDAYFDENGKPTILGIYKHYFASAEDVSDRVYFTSKKIIFENLPIFTEFVEKIGKLSGVKNFPVHVEVRLDKERRPVPIEINPFRFGGWCTTADMTFYSLGFNPYEYYFKSHQVNWENILAKMDDDNIFSIIVLNNSTGVDGQKITSFNYDLLCAQFSKVLELRKIDYKQHPVFGFLFVQTQDFSELEKIAKSTLKEFVLP